MKVVKEDIELIKAIHKQYHLAKDEKARKGLRYVLKDILGRYLLQIKHYEPWVSEKAEKVIKKKLPSVSIARIKLHDCNVENAVILSADQKKLFVDGNKYDTKLFHLEHDPPTIQVANSILEEKNITDTEIKKKLKPYRLCFVTVEENKQLDKAKWRSNRPPNAYKLCDPPIIAHKVSE